ncbi:hypothetical protein GIB67_037989, partial [Kingdonia uniflora]
EIISREDNVSYYKISMLSWRSRQKDNPKPVPLVMIPKGEAVPSRDFQKKIDELTVKYEDVVKRLKEKESFVRGLASSNEERISQRRVSREGRSNIY